MKFAIFLLVFWFVGCAALLCVAHYAVEHEHVVIDIQPGNDGGLEGPLDREALVRTLNGIAFPRRTR